MINIKVYNAEQIGGCFTIITTDKTKIIKVGFLFVDKIFDEEVLISEITEADYKQGMEILNKNCQYMGDNIVYIRAKTLEKVKFDNWKILRDSELRPTI